MNDLTFRLTGASPIMFGKPVFEKKGSDETHDQFEERAWRNKVATNEEGQVYIQPFALKNALESAGSRLSMKLTKSATYTKLLRQGVLVVNPLLLFKPGTTTPVTIEDVKPLPLFVPSDGKRGGKTRVMRVFPELRGWWCEATITALDGRLTREVVMKHLEEAGKFIGFGSMRVENGGINGRFSVE